MSNKLAEVVGSNVSVYYPDHVYKHVAGDMGSEREMTIKMANGSLHIDYDTICILLAKMNREIEARFFLPEGDDEDEEENSTTPKYKKERTIKRRQGILAEKHKMKRENLGMMLKCIEKMKEVRNQAVQEELQQKFREAMGDE